MYHWFQHTYLLQFIPLFPYNSSPTLLSTLISLKYLLDTRLPFLHTKFIILPRYIHYHLLLPLYYESCLLSISRIRYIGSRSVEKLSFILVTPFLIRSANTPIRSAYAPLPTPSANAMSGQFIVPSKVLYSFTLIPFLSTPTMLTFMILAGSHSTNEYYWEDY